MTDPKTERLDRLAIDMIRTLAIDGVQQADPGDHDGGDRGILVRGSGSGQASLPTRSAASGPPSPTTPTLPIRASSTMTSTPSASAAG